MLEMITGAALFLTGLLSGIFINKNVGFKSIDLKKTPMSFLKKSEKLMDPIYLTEEREKEIVEDANS